LEISDSDIDLVKALQNGSVEAFDLIYKRYSGKLYSFGLKYLGSVSDTEELIQSVFLKVWENRERLKKELSLKSYLFTIAYNDICKHFRKRNYHKLFIGETINANLQSTSSTEEGIDYRSIIDRIELILDTLPEKQKQAFKKSRFEGMATKDIADELKLSPGTIDNYVSETLKFLKNKIQANDFIIILFVTLFIDY
jgi:RNA polymerase sigma-70 factor (ECF subfamily)